MALPCGRELERRAARLSGSPVIRTIRPGDTSKPDPVTIVIIANPTLETPWNSGAFVPDPIMHDQPAFDACVQHINTALFSGLRSQRERLLADPAIAPKIRVLSLFVSGLPAVDANSLVAQDSVSDLLIARRNVFVPFLTTHGARADVAYAVSRSASHSRASAWLTSDDDGRPGVSFALDGVTLYHRHFARVPGAIALHASSTSLAAVHEFGHALSSYENGQVVDLYVDGRAGVNNKRARPIPNDFAVYNGTTFPSDPARDGLGYPVGWQSYHCELTDPTVPAVMDNYWQAPSGVPEHCQHDAITRRFLRDRLLAKIAR